MYDVICIGIGEIGKSLFELINGVYKTLPIDPIHYPGNKNVSCETISFMHICIPGDIEGFDQIVLDYGSKYDPRITIIHSTVIPGTTQVIHEKMKDRNGGVVVHSPVHGKHHQNNMKKDMLRYPKYIGIPKEFKNSERNNIIKHFTRVGFSDIRIVEGTDQTEWLKLLSTTYFGLVIAWSQEVERICNKFNLDYDTITDFFKYQDDIKPPHYPGVIGGHCIMPNIEFIKKVWGSELLGWIEKSNNIKRSN